MKNDIVHNHAVNTSCQSGITTIGNQLNHMPDTAEAQGTGQLPSEESPLLSSSGELPKQKDYCVE